MINASELRIGNKLQKENGKIYTVSRLDGTKDILVEEERGLFTLNYNLYGIPLTPEILDKCGFEKSNRIDFGELKQCYVIFSLALMIRHDSYFIDWVGGNTEARYLHQLQNLYFALTGEELNYQQ